MRFGRPGPPNTRPLSIATRSAPAANASSASCGSWIPPPARIGTDGPHASRIARTVSSASTRRRRAHDARRRRRGAPTPSTTHAAAAAARVAAVARRSASAPRGGTTSNSGRGAAPRRRRSPSTTARPVRHRPAAPAGIATVKPATCGASAAITSAHRLATRRDCQQPRHRAEASDHGRARRVDAGQPRRRRRRGCVLSGGSARTSVSVASRSTREPADARGVGDERADLDEAEAEARERARRAQAGIEAAAEPDARREARGRATVDRKAVGRPHVAEDRSIRSPAGARPAERAHDRRARSRAVRGGSANSSGRRTVR